MQTSNTDDISKHTLGGRESMYKKDQTQQGGMDYAYYQTNMYGLGSGGGGGAAGTEYAINYLPYSFQYNGGQGLGEGAGWTTSASANNPGAPAGGNVDPTQAHFAALNYAQAGQTEAGYFYPHQQYYTTNPYWAGIAANPAHDYAGAGGTAALSWDLSTSTNAGPPGHHHHGAPAALTGAAGKTSVPSYYPSQSHQALSHQQQQAVQQQGGSVPNDSVTAGGNDPGTAGSVSAAGNATAGSSGTTGHHQQQTAQTSTADELHQLETSMKHTSLHDSGGVGEDQGQAQINHHTGAGAGAGSGRDSGSGKSYANAAKQVPRGSAATMGGGAGMYSSVKKGPPSYPVQPLMSDSGSKLAGRGGPSMGMWEHSVAGGAGVSGGGGYMGGGSGVFAARGHASSGYSAQGSLGRGVGGGGGGPSLLWQPSSSNNTWAATMASSSPNAVSGSSASFNTGNADMDARLLELSRTINSKQLEVKEPARFFVIKSYSEDDIHRSIKYGVWCSTDSGNRKLHNAYEDMMSKLGAVYLFFSVNGSGHFCGVAEMTSDVDTRAEVNYWTQQNKWKGKFEVHWRYVKDVPNSQLRHIRLESNENKPVTNSRDATEVEPAEKGMQVIKVIHSFKHNTSIFDDFQHYEKRELDKRCGQADY